MSSRKPGEPSKQKRRRTKVRVSQVADAGRNDMNTRSYYLLDSGINLLKLDRKMNNKQAKIDLSENSGMVMARNGQKQLMEKRMTTSWASDGAARRRLSITW